MSQIPVQLIESELGGLLIGFPAQIENLEVQFILDTALLKTEISKSFPFKSVPRDSLNLVIGDESAKLTKTIGQTDSYRLGLDFLTGRLVALDLLNGSVNFRSYSQALKTGRVLTFEWPNSGKPLVRVKINGQSYRALFDTGVPFTIVDSAFVAANPDAFEPLESANAGELSEHRDGSNKLKFQKVKALELAGKRISGTALVIDFEKMFPQGQDKFSFVLGANFLADDLWILDFAR